MNNPNDGATPEPAQQSDDCAGKSGQAHHWQWVWNGLEWTNKVRCGTCGLVIIRDRSKQHSGQ